MPVSIARLRRWFIAALVVVCIAVGGTYLYLRHRVTNALKQVPGKIGIEIQESAEGFTISKSEQGRTLFKLQASKAVQFKQGGRAELHDVTIMLYGHDASRFDQVYGEAFEYDPQSGNATSTGEVSIDLQANPQGILHPDQTMPKELKNPIHLKTSNLVFNKNTGDAWTSSTIEFRVPQANGSAVGARYVAKQGALTLESQIKIIVNGTMPATLLAEKALLEKSPRQIVLIHPRAESPEQQGHADELTFLLNQDNTLERAIASGNVKLESRDVHARDSRARQPRAAGATWSAVSAQRLDVKVSAENKIKDAVLSGDVRFRSKGTQMLEGSAERAILDFGGRNSLSKVHANGGVKLAQGPSVPGGRGIPPPRQKHDGAQDFEITSPAMDFLVADQKLTHAETIGAPEIVLSPAGTNPQSATTRITADKFTATFDSLGQLSQVHGAANAQVVSSSSPQKNVPQADRISTSDSIDAFFRSGTGIESIVQEGHFAYHSGPQQAYADSARYTPADQILTLIGSPRVVDAGMGVTADTIRLNRETGDGFAKGDVKTSYSELKPQPGGALLATADPIHVTAKSMTAHADPAVATYTGSARLWQNANVIEAPSIQFEKDQRTVIAESKGDQKVSTVLIGTDKSGKTMPVTVTSTRLTYRDSERKAHFDGGVTVGGSDLRITARQMDVFLAQASSKGEEARAPSPAHNGNITNTPVAPQSKIDKIVASGAVVITEPKRRATGENLTYTASDDKFVLTGGPPSIFDAEHGKITAVSLTLFRRDARVEVEGDSKSPAVTETRVVR